MKKIIPIFLIILVSINCLYLYQCHVFSSMAKEIFEESYNTYGEKVPEKYKDMVSDELFSDMNHRIKDPKIAEETSKVRKFYVNYGFRKTVVFLHFDYFPVDGNGDDLPGGSTNRDVRFDFIKKDGKWILKRFEEYRW